MPPPRLFVLNGVVRDLIGNGRRYHGAQFLCRSMNLSSNVLTDAGRCRRLSCKSIIDLNTHCCQLINIP